MNPIDSATQEILQTGLLGAIIVILALVIVWLQRRNDSERKALEEEVRSTKLQLLNDWKSGSIIKDQLISEVRDVIKTLVESFKQPK